jgi:signal transduction histidine kinase
VQIAAAERARITRELHDMVANDVSVMVVLADGASYALPSDPDRVRQALAAIASTGRQVLAEMRRTLRQA